jgi:ribosome-binding protein aMBF1 (putative translation factor)
MPVKKKTRRAARQRSKRMVLVSFDNAEFRDRFENARREWAKRFSPLVEGARSAQQLTERDLAIRINARG